MTTEERPMTPLEMLAYMVEQGAPAYAIANQRRLCGLPDEPAPTIRIRTAPAPVRRPRRAPKKATPAPKDPAAQARGRFDLLEFEDTND